jgi:hypothetical protein
MKTWYEKVYGVPPPVKKTGEPKPLFEILQDERKKVKNEAWEKAKSDYLKHIINQNAV